MAVTGGIHVSLKLILSSLDILWEYRAEGFYTLSQGYAQRLANGNTLVTESERGRAFEITNAEKNCLAIPSS